MTGSFLPAALALALASGLAGAGWSRRALRRADRIDPDTAVKRARGLVAVAFGPILLLPAHLLLAARPELQWRLPFWLQLCYRELAWGIAIAATACVLGFGAATYWAARHPRRRMVLALAVALGLVLVAAGGRQTRREPCRLGPPRLSQDGAILQSSRSTCAPAAAANVAGVLGVKTTEAELAELCGTTADGTLPAQVARGLRAFGIDARKRTAPDGSIAQVEPPAVLFMAGGLHAAAYMGITNGLAEIWDPASGKRFLPPELVQRIWSGQALECRRRPSPAQPPLRPPR